MGLAEGAKSNGSKKVDAMKGPGYRRDLDVRRVWRCPACGAERRLSGEYTSVRCGCRPEGVWMQIVSERNAVPRPAASMSVPEIPVAHFQLTEEELAKPLEGRIRLRNSRFPAENSPADAAPHPRDRGRRGPAGPPPVAGRPSDPSPQTRPPVAEAATDVEAPSGEWEPGTNMANTASPSVPPAGPHEPRERNDRGPRQRQQPRPRRERRPPREGSGDQSGGENQQMDVIVPPVVADAALSMGDLSSAPEQNASPHGSERPRHQPHANGPRTDHPRRERQGGHRRDRNRPPGGNHQRSEPSQREERATERSEPARSSGNVSEANSQPSVHRPIPPRPPVSEDEGFGAGLD